MGAQKWPPFFGYWLEVEPSSEELSTFPLLHSKRTNILERL